MRSSVAHHRARLDLRQAPLLALSSLSLLLALGACRTIPPDFALVVHPAALTLEAGGAAASVTIRLRPEGGFRGDVELNVSGVPEGVSATLSSDALAVASGGAQAAGAARPANATTVTLTLAAAASAAAGEHPPLLIVGHAVAPPASAWAMVELTVNAPQPPDPPGGPANDAFSDAEPLGGAYGSIAASTLGASREPGEPAHAGVPGGGSLWWRWTAPASAQVSFDTYGSAIDTALAVYLGDLLVALTPVASEASAASAFVAFEASAGASYRIAVVGRDPEGGDVTLTWGIAGTIDWTAEPDRLTFGGVVDAGAPAPQSFTLRSEAAATAPFRVSTEAAWIDAEPTAGALSSGALALPIEVSVGACAQASEDDGTLTVRGRGGELALPVRRVCSARTHTLSLSGANGRVAVAGDVHPLPWTGAFPAGEMVALEALPDGGYVFEHWGGALSGRTNPTTLLLNDDEAVTLSFVPEPPQLHQLTVTRSGAGTGSVGSDPAGIDCGTACAATYLHGATVTLSASPAAGSTFTGWGGACGGTGTCTLPMIQASDVSASFALAPALEVTPASRDVGVVVVGDASTTAFTVRNAGGGTLSGGASVASPFSIAGGGPYELAAGQSATVTVGFSPTTVGTVSRDVTFGGADGASRSVRGEGVPATVGLSVSVDGFGAGTVASDPPGIDCGAACSADFPRWSTVTLTATASSGSGLASWSGCASTSGTACTVEMTEARSLGVTFEQLHDPRIDRIYVNQAVPSQDSLAPPGQRIPLVANRAGLLRVFVTSDVGGAVGNAEVRLHHRHAPDAPETVVLLDGPAWLPAGTGEEHFGDSFATHLEPHVMRAGLQAYVSVTGSSYGEAVAARYPESGFWALHVVHAPTLDLKLVPVTYRGTTPALGDGRAYLERTQRMFAFAEDGIDIEIGAAYAFHGDLSVRQGWHDLIEAMWWQRLFDPDRPHYYALVDAGPDRDVNGVGYLGHPVAVGHSLAGAVDTVAHELGHNWNRLHAPCGNPPSVDAGYPYPNGSIGVWGYDLVDRQLKSPSVYADVMGYCRPRWVSDHTYRGAMDYRGSTSADALAGVAADVAADGTGPSAPAAAEPLLVVTGRRDADGWHLEAPFVLSAAPEPIPDGPYRLRAWDAGGATIVDVAFGTVPLSDPAGSEAILLTIPLGRADVPRLAGLRIEEGGRVLVERSALLRPLATRPTQATRLPDGSVRMTWDVQAYPAALVRDGVDGPLLARDRSGEVRVTPSGTYLEVLLSDGLNTVVEVLAP